MNDIFLQRFSDTSGVPKANADQIKRASDLIKRLDLKDFSVFQFTNPGKLLLPIAQPLSKLNVVFRFLVSLLLVNFIEISFKYWNAILWFVKSITLTSHPLHFVIIMQTSLNSCTYLTCFIDC